MKRVLIIDHYDSFTYTIKSYFECLGALTQVVQFDDEHTEVIDLFRPSHLVLSPGPGAPDEVKPTLDLIHQYYTTYPILGICLGHQCIAQVFGGKVIQADCVMHGKQSIIYHQNAALFKDIPLSFSAIRYHSLVVEEQSLPDSLVTTAWTYDKSNARVVMALAHQHYPVFGIQYHPEAIMTAHGFVVLKNFLDQEPCMFSNKGDTCVFGRINE